MKYHLLELKFVTAKDAESSCREIAGALPSNVIQNTTSFLGDTAAVQIKTQRLLSMHFDMITGNQEHLPQYTCLLHTGKLTIFKKSNILYLKCLINLISGNSLGRYHNTAMPSDIKILLDVVEEVFGDREGSTFHKISLKQPLEDRLSLDGAKKKGVKIVNRLGSRGGVYAANSLAIIQYREHIVPVIEAAIIKAATKTTVAGAKQLTKLKNIYNMLTVSWERIRLCLGTVLMLQLFLAGIIYRAENHHLSVKDKKKLVADVVERYQKILHQTGRPFEKLRCLGLRQDCSLSEAEKSTVQEADVAYQNASPDVQAEVDQFIAKAAKGALDKVLKDCRELMNLPDSDELVPSTNRNLEGSFGCYKQMEKTFTAMDPMMQETVTRAMVNKLIHWFDTKSPEEQQQLLSDAKKDRAYDQAQVKASKTALKRRRTFSE